MRKTIIKFAGLAVILSSMLVACKKNQTELLPQEESKNFQTMSVNNPSVIYNGHWLEFINLEQFETTLENLENGGIQSIENFELQFPAFESLRKKLELLELDESPNSIDIDEAAQNGSILHTNYDEFGALITSNGQVQIGDSIYCYTSEQFSYVIHKNYKQNIINNADLSTIPSSRAFETSFYKNLRARPFPGISVIDPSPYLTLDPGNIFNPPSFQMCDFRTKNTSEWGDNVKYETHDNSGNVLPKDGGRAIKMKFKFYNESYGLGGQNGSRVYILKNTSGSKWKEKKSVKWTELKIRQCGRGAIYSLATTPYLIDYGPISKSGNSYNNNDYKLRLHGFGEPMGADLRLHNLNVHVNMTIKGVIIDKYYIW